MGGEARGEALQGGGHHRFGAVEGAAPGGEIESGQLLVPQAGQADFVGEVGGRRQRAPVAVNGPQPTAGTGEKIEGRQQYQGQAEIEGGQPGADQTHVVVEGEPTDQDIGFGYLRGPAHGADVGQQVGVGEDHPFGIAGTAGGVLQHRGGGGLGRRRYELAGVGRQIGHRQQMFQVRKLKLEEAGEGPGLGEGNQGRGRTGRKNGQLPAQMVFELRQARRRIDRRRRGAEKHHAQKGGQVVGAGRQHDRDPFPRRDAQGL